MAIKLAFNNGGDVATPDSGYATFFIDPATGILTRKDSNGVLSTYLSYSEEDSEGYGYLLKYFKKPVAQVVDEMPEEPTEGLRIICFEDEKLYEYNTVDEELVPVEDTNIALGTQVYSIAEQLMYYYNNKTKLDEIVIDWTVDGVCRNIIRWGDYIVLNTATWLMLYNPVTKSKSKVTAVTGDITDLAADSAGNLWVGTAADGVWKYDGEFWTQYQIGDDSFPFAGATKLFSNPDSDIVVAIYNEYSAAPTISIVEDGDHIDIEISGTGIDSDSVLYPKPYPLTPGTTQHDSLVSDGCIVDFAWDGGSSSWKMLYKPGAVSSYPVVVTADDFIIIPTTREFGIAAFNDNDGWVDDTAKFESESGLTGASVTVFSGTMDEDGEIYVCIAEATLTNKAFTGIHVFALVDEGAMDPQYCTFVVPCLYPVHRVCFNHFSVYSSNDGVLTKLLGNSECGYTFEVPFVLAGLVYLFGVLGQGAAMLYRFNEETEEFDEITMVPYINAFGYADDAARVEGTPQPIDGKVQCAYADETTGFVYMTISDRMFRYYVGVGFVEGVGNVG